MISPHRIPVVGTAYSRFLLFGRVATTTVPTPEQVGVGVGRLIAIRLHILGATGTACRNVDPTGSGIWQAPCIRSPTAIYPARGRMFALLGTVANHPCQVP
jgi:hypothetical protein